MTLDSIINIKAFNPSTFSENDHSITKLKFNVNYNNDYVLYSAYKGLGYKPSWSNNNSRLYLGLKNEVESKYGQKISSLLYNAIMEKVNFGIVTVPGFQQETEYLKRYINTFLEPGNTIHAKGSYFVLEDVFTNFNTPMPNLCYNKSSNFISGGGLVGIYKNNNIEPLFALVVKKDRVQLPRLSWLSDTPIMENDGMFQLYVQGGFDYKDTPYKSYRSLYRKHILPWAEKFNIPIVTRPNLVEDLFLVPKMPTFASAREADQYGKQLFVDAFDKLKEQHQIVETIEESMPW